MNTIVVEMVIHISDNYSDSDWKDDGSDDNKQGGRTWQPFVEGKNGHKNFRQARIYNFRVKCIVFARNRKINSVKYAIYTM